MTDFRDGLALSYWLETKNIPIKSPRSETFSLWHSLHCAKKGTQAPQLNLRRIRSTHSWRLLRCRKWTVALATWSQSFDKKTTNTEDETRLKIQTNSLRKSRFSRILFLSQYSNRLRNHAPKKSTKLTKFTNPRRNSNWGNESWMLRTPHYATFWNHRWSCPNILQIMTEPA